MASFPTCVKMGGSGRTGPKGGTSSLAVTDTCEGKNSQHLVSVHLRNLFGNYCFIQREHQVGENTPRSDGMPHLSRQTRGDGAIHLVGCFVRPLWVRNPPNHQETVQEVRLDNIRQKRGFSLLVDQSYDVVTDVPLPLELHGKRRREGKACEGSERCIGGTKWTCEWTREGTCGAD